MHSQLSHQRSWRRHIGPALLLGVLLLVTHPELRALLFVANAIGADLFVLMFVTQLRFYAPWAWMLILPVALGLGLGMLGPVARAGLATMFDRWAWRSLTSRVVSTLQ